MLGGALVLRRLLHGRLVAHVAVDGRGRHWVHLLLLEEGGVGALAADSAANVRCLVKLILEQPVRLPDEVHIRLLGPSLADGTVSS